MSLLKKKLLKEAAGQEKEELVTSFYSLQLPWAFEGASLEQDPDFYYVFKYCLRNGVSIRLVEEVGDSGGWPEIELFGERSDVRKVYIKFWDDGSADHLKGKKKSEAHDENFSEFAKRAKPRVMWSHTVDFDIKKIPQHVLYEVFAEGLFIKDYDKDAKTARLVGMKAPLNKVFRKYFSSSEGETVKVKESLENRFMKLAGLPLLTESYDEIGHEVNYDVTVIESFYDNESSRMEFEDSSYATAFMEELKDEIEVLHAKLQDDRMLEWMDATASNYDGGEEVRALYQQVIDHIAQAEDVYNQFYDKISELG